MSWILKSIQHNYISVLHNHNGFLIRTAPEFSWEKIENFYCLLCSEFVPKHISTQVNLCGFFPFTYGNKLTSILTENFDITGIYNSDTETLHLEEDKWADKLSKLLISHNKKIKRIRLLNGSGIDCIV